jgi:hypothetical protein
MFHVYQEPAPAPPKPKPIAFSLKLIPHTASGGIRLVAVYRDTGKRIPDGNLVKIKADGTIYLYHTVNPALGLPLDRNGRLLCTTYF